MKNMKIVIQSLVRCFEVGLFKEGVVSGGKIGMTWVSVLLIRRVFNSSWLPSRLVWRLNR